MSAMNPQVQTGDYLTLDRLDSAIVTISGSANGTSGSNVYYWPSTIYNNKSNITINPSLFSDLPLQIDLDSLSDNNKIAFVLAGVKIEVKKKRLIEFFKKFFEEEIFIEKIFGDIK